VSKAVIYTEYNFLHTTLNCTDYIYRQADSSGFESTLRVIPQRKDSTSLAYPFSAIPSITLAGTT
jgi:hypothetical protein